MFEAYWGALAGFLVTVLGLYSLRGESTVGNEARMPKWHLYLSLGASPVLLGMIGHAFVTRPSKADATIFDHLIVWVVVLGYPYLCYRLFNRYRKVRLTWSEQDVSFTNERTTIQFDWDDVESVSYWPRRSLFVILLQDETTARVPVNMSGMRAFCHALKNHVHESRLERAIPGFRMLSL